MKFYGDNKGSFLGMGNEISRCKMESPLKDVLKANGTPLKTKTARTFLREVAEVAPWFIDEGLLNMPQWEHLGEDLKCCPSVTPGTLAVWSLVKVCLQSTREPLKQAVQQGGEVLEQVREESRKGSSKDSDPGSESSEGLSDSELQEIGEKGVGEKKKSYSFQALQDLEIIRQQFESKETGLQKVLEELKMQREVMKQLKAEVQAEAKAQPELKAGVTDKAQLELEADVTPPPLSNPSAPPCECPPIGPAAPRRVIVQSVRHKVGERSLIRAKGSFLF